MPTPPGPPARRSRCRLLAPLVAILLLVPAVPAWAGGWPQVWHAYGRFDGVAFSDPIDQPAGNSGLDLSSGTAAAPLPSVYAAADGTNLNIRFRLATSPGNGAGWDTAKGGLTNYAFVVELAVAGVHVATVGVDGNNSAADYVYVAPTSDRLVGSVLYTRTNPKVVSMWNGTTIPGAQVSNAGNPDAPAETFLDFTVPLSEIALMAPSVTASTPMQFNFGTSAAANLVTVNKDYMNNAGTTCAQFGCAEGVIGDAQLGLVWSSTTPVAVSGTNPPTVGQESRYDLTLYARNLSLNSDHALKDVEVTDLLPSHMSVISASTASGTVSVDGRSVTWSPADLPAQRGAALTLRVAVTPNGSHHGGAVALTNGLRGSAVDAATGTASAAALTAVTVGPVAGSLSSADIAVSKAGPDTATRGAQAVYTLGAKNLGPAAAPTTLTDTLPSGLTYVSAVGTGWGCSATGRTVTCSHAAALAAGASAPPVTVTATVDSDAPATLVNGVTSTGSAADANTTNNAAQATTSVAQPDPEPSATPDPEPSSSPDPDPSPSSSPDPEPTPSPDPSPTADPSPSSSPEPAPSAEPDPAPSSSPDPEPSPTADPEPSSSPAPEPSPDPSPDPDPSPTADPLPVPLVHDDTTTVQSGATVTVAVLANDSAPGSGLSGSSLRVVQPPGKGAAQVADGMLVYTPRTGELGDDVFSYEVCNTHGACARAQITITITAPPETTPTPDPAPPGVPVVLRAVDDYAGGRTGEAVTVDVLANDLATGTTFDASSVTVTQQPSHATIELVDPTTGAVTYRPEDTYEGTDEFVYAVCTAAGMCTSATVFTATPPVDMEVSVTALRAAPRRGDPVSYAVTVTNNGPRFADAPLILALSSSAELSDVAATGAGWEMDSATATVHAMTVSGVAAPSVPPVVRAVSVPLTLTHAAGLGVGDSSVITLTGTVTGSPGSQILVGASVAGPFIELVYANNEAQTAELIMGGGTGGGTTPDSGDADEEDPSPTDDPSGDDSDGPDITPPPDPDRPDPPSDPEDGTTDVVEPEESVDGEPVPPGSGEDGSEGIQGRHAGTGRDRSRNVPGIEGSALTLAATGIPMRSMLLAPVLLLGGMVLLHLSNKRRARG